MKSVFAAIRRWEDKTLVDGALADRLRAEVAESSAAGTQRLFQYVLAATAAVILLIASGVFLDWAWPRMTELLRSALLALAGLAVHLGGTRLEGRQRWLPAGYLMQTAGLVLLAVALAYSERAWADASAGGIAVGLVALAVPFALGIRTLRLNDVMPAIHFAMGLEFLVIFLDRATPLQDQSIIWIVDGVLLAAMVGVLMLLRRDQNLERHPWALNAFSVALYAGFVLVLFSAEALNLGDDVVYALDAWLILTVSVTVYGIHWAPEGLRRETFGSQVALLQLAWIPLGFASTVGVVDGPPEAALVAVGGSGVAGFLYARQNRVRAILAVSALSFVSGAWYWGVERGGALGAVFALAATAVLLFWLSGKSSDAETGSRDG